MRWRDLLHLDLGRLLRGKVEVPPPSGPISERTEFPIRMFNTLCLFVKVSLDLGVRLLKFPFTLFRAQKQLDLIAVTEQLARVVACNAPLVPALEAIALDAPMRRVATVLRRLRNALSGGNSLSEAMGLQSRFFPPYYVDLVRAGENTGTLQTTLSDLRLSLTDSARLADTLRKSLSYLAVLALANVLILAFCARVFVPVFADVLKDMGGSLPYPMAAGMSIGDFVSRTLERVLIPFSLISSVSESDRFLERNFYALQLVVYVAALAGMTVWLWRTRLVTVMRGCVLSWIPGVRGLVVRANLARASRILGKLLAAGYPLDEALQTVAGLYLNPPTYARVFVRVGQRVRAGETFAAALDRERLFPASFRGLVAVGESAGKLPEALERLAHLYESQVNKVGRILMDTVAPLGVVALGCCTMAACSSLFYLLTGLVDALIANN